MNKYLEKIAGHYEIKTKDKWSEDQLNDYAKQRKVKNIGAIAGSASMIGGAVASQFLKNPKHVVGSVLGGIAGGAVGAGVVAHQRQKMNNIIRSPAYPSKTFNLPEGSTLEDVKKLISSK